ncbi:MAG: YbhB/YbcL family Raf kinase inhibitor-like protein [Leptolyngbyaceae bacterium]|nr:YbhB/YbcL family Raf kinase inhibitor-like protein [Leptolyngbyaceae bacterium]
MHLQSPAFPSNGSIPAQFTCDGINISPPLHWDSPPVGTQSLALVVDDPDAPQQTFTHWVIYNLPTYLRELPEGVAPYPQLPEGSIQGKNDFGRLGFGGPCPPRGTHRYFFKLFALDQQLPLAPGASKTEVMQAMTGHILESVELIGCYARQGDR